MRVMHGLAYHGAEQPACLRLLLALLMDETRWDMPGSCSVSRSVSAKESYGALDLLKFLMAIAVVNIHTAPLLNTPIYEGVLNISEIAVPFFFIASGFLCFRKCNIADIASAKDSASSIRVRSTIKQLFLMYIIWSLLYLPITAVGIMQGYSADTSPVRIIAHLAFQYVIVGEQYLSWPLWYLLASVYAFAILYFALRRGLRWKPILLFSGVLMVLAYTLVIIVEFGLGGGFAGLQGFATKVVGTGYLIRNGLCPGLLYVSLGAFLSQVRREIRLAPLVIGLVAGLAGLWFLGGYCDPFCALAAGCLFALCVRKPDGKAFVFARDSSKVIYFTHMWFVFILSYFIFAEPTYSVTASAIPPLVRFAFPLVCSLLLSALVWKLRGTKAIKILFRA